MGKTGSGGGRLCWLTVLRIIVVDLRGYLNRAREKEPFDSGATPSINHGGHSPTLSDA